MTRTILSLWLLLTIAFCMATALQSPFDRVTTNSGSSLLVSVLGEGRRLFANHFFSKADAYFHRGYYPTIFDRRPSTAPTHLQEASEGEKHDDHDEEGGDFLKRPTDWIDRFGRNFFPSKHSHLGEGGGGEEREILPWLRLTAELDPQKIETYTVAAYWLRTRMGRSDEAEQFLREGLRANPGNAEITLELGLIYKENRKDPERARNVLELARHRWEEQNRQGAKPAPFVYERIIGQLERLEEEQGSWKEALSYLEILKRISPIPDAIEKQIEELKPKVTP